MNKNLKEKSRIVDIITSDKFIKDLEREIDEGGEFVYNTDGVYNYTK